MRNPAEPDVVVVGNVGIDTNVYLAPGAVLADVVLEVGQFATDLEYVGQAGGFTSRGFASLGLDTSFIGHVGVDPLGDWVRAELSADGIDLAGLGVDPAAVAEAVQRGQLGAMGLCAAGQQRRPHHPGPARGADRAGGRAGASRIIGRSTQR